MGEDTVQDTVTILHDSITRLSQDRGKLPARDYIVSASRAAVAVDLRAHRVYISIDFYYEQGGYSSPRDVQQSLKAAVAGLDGARTFGSLGSETDSPGHLLPVPRISELARLNRPGIIDAEWEYTFAS